MLTMTENANDVVKQIVDQTVGSGDAGLRISQDGDDAAALALSAVETPEAGDQVVEGDGARLFLDESAAASLEDKVLDAQVDGEGAVQFALGEQG